MNNKLFIGKDSEGNEVPLDELWIRQNISQVFPDFYDEIYDDKHVGKGHMNLPEVLRVVDHDNEVEGLFR